MIHNALCTELERDSNGNETGNTTKAEIAIGGLGLWVKISFKINLQLKMAA